MDLDMAFLFLLGFLAFVTFGVLESCNRPRTIEEACAKSIQETKKEMSKEVKELCDKAMEKK